MDVSTPDAIVVGLGAVGSAICHHLSKSGAKVVGIDRFRPPHDQGSSHGLTRITRLAVGEGAAFVPLAMRSHELWRELEAASGESLYRRTGGLIVASEAAGPNAFHGQRRSHRRQGRPGGGVLPRRADRLAGRHQRQHPGHRVRRPLKSSTPGTGPGCCAEAAPRDRSGGAARSAHAGGA